MWVAIWRKETRSHRAGKWGKKRSKPVFFRLSSTALHNEGVGFFLFPRLVRVLSCSFHTYVSSTCDISVAYASRSCISYIYMYHLRLRYLRILLCRRVCIYIYIYHIVIWLVVRRIIGCDHTTSTVYTRYSSSTRNLSRIKNQRGHSSGALDAVR